MDTSEWTDEFQVSFYFTYVSRTGTRTPTTLPSGRDDEVKVESLVENSGEPRHIELGRLIEACSTE
jgi:hypothetical protein